MENSVPAKMKCPRCEAKLYGQGEFFLCPDSHGLLMSLDAFRAQTSPSFVQKLWTHWSRLRHRPGPACPACRGRMVVLNHDAVRNPEVGAGGETRPFGGRLAPAQEGGGEDGAQLPALHFEIDCCPHCFSVWLDQGESARLKAIFHRNPNPVSEAEWTGLARSLLAREEERGRWAAVERFGRASRSGGRLWWLLPSWWWWW